MSPLFIVVFALALAIAAGLVLLVWALDFIAAHVPWGATRPTWKQRRAWKRERLKFNPRLGVRS